MNSPIGRDENCGRARAAPGPMPCQPGFLTGPIALASSPAGRQACPGCAASIPTRWLWDGHGLTAQNSDIPAASSKSIRIISGKVASLATMARSLPEGILSSASS